MPTHPHRAGESLGATVTTTGRTIEACRCETCRLFVVREEGSARPWRTPADYVLCRDRVASASLI